MEKYVPDIYQKSIYTIDYDKLLNRGIKCLLFDLDNTIVPVNIKVPNKKVRDLFFNLKEKGFTVIIFSNAPKIRLKPFKEELEVDCCAHARKPRKKKFLKVINEYNFSVDEIAIIGDQLFSDILGGNRIGITTILINPISKYDDIFTRLVKRKMEVSMFKKLRDAGLFTKGKYYD
ncbi:MAG: YqeG family HAD IIIA-type phosphatase [Bacilli bacterium]|nr:YqeG family HAD IIIA-type phosphatase [Bacilli bacterium]